jgi:CHAT domain-containing protein
VPFASLVLNAAGEPTYLGVEKPLLYTYSLTGIARSPRPARKTGAATEVFAVGLSLFGKPTNETLSLFYGPSPPQALDQATTEAAAVADLYGARALNEGRASEREVRAGIGQADIVHVATHGFVFPDSMLSMASGVVLSPAGSAATKDDDGMLQAWEVLTQLQLRARLVVLSACQTGIGPEESVESLGRLTRSFQSAGAQAVVASQWLVADESTLGLMVEFHQRLRRGMRKDDALREAISRLKDDPQTRHPYFWAPFIITGNPERI